MKGFGISVGSALALFAFFGCFVWFVGWDPEDGLPHSLLSKHGTFVGAQDKSIQVRPEKLFIRRHYG